jgi:hypothetical protein
MQAIPNHEEETSGMIRGKYGDVSTHMTISTRINQAFCGTKTLKEW